VSPMQGIGAIELEKVRRFFAEEIRAVSNLRSEALVEALVAVPREEYLGPGPWLIRGADYELQGALSVRTRDADPRQVYHNVAVAIDPERHLYNGQPATLISWVNQLDLKPGERVLHIGCATGYYTAIMAHVVGSTGHVTAVEIDPDLAQRAKENLGKTGWVDIRHGDGTANLPRSVDAIVINAGVTHPTPAWLDAMADGGRMVLPMTCVMDALPATLGKGVVLLVTRNGPDYGARIFAMVAIYSCVGIRDTSLNKMLGGALAKGNWFGVRRLIRTAHKPSPTCWLHGDSFCLSTE
jgi:protein-L-isoaspartate(D-aspartate) O-methyltransferase